MHFTAVVFDLFGTLVNDITGLPYDLTAARMASALSIPSDDFSRLWFDTVHERNIGKFQTLEYNIEYICQKLGVLASDEQVRAAATIRCELAKKSMMVPRDGSLETISKLRERSLKIGLISDCSPSEPKIWLETPFRPLFDVTVFSCLVGLKKPDIEIYQLAANQLGVKCADCLYIGNGGSNELCGAYKANMYPVLVLPEKDAEPYLQPDENIKDFALLHGTVISSIDEVLTLV